MDRQKQQKRGLVIVTALFVTAGIFFGVPLHDRQQGNEPKGPLAPYDITDELTASNDAGTVMAHDDDPTVASVWRDQRLPERTWLSQVSKKQRTLRSPAPDTFVTINEKTYPLRTYRMLASPNDPYATQWWTTSTGLTAAWDITPGAYQTTLAVIDTGFALAHEDLEGRWHENTGETGPATAENPSQLNCTDRGLALDYSCNLVDDDVDGVVDNESGVAPYENPSRRNCTDQSIALAKTCNRIDDEGNGYIDDVQGWDVINQDNSVQAGELSPGGSGTTHGTMVAGTAAATGDNAKGIAGVDWQTKILPIQALDDDGYGDTRSVGQGIYYAIDQGVDVINISLGTEYHDDYVREAIETATAAGITVVASSGNDGCECVAYPARYPEVVAVGALDTNGTLASFSSWGSAVDITAPGTNFTLPSWSATDQTARYVSGVAGTSFSSPFVAGMVTLLKSHIPEAKPLHLIAALHETANRSQNTPENLPSTRYGYGMIDAAAVRQRMVTPRHNAQSYVLSPVNAGNYFATQPVTEADATYTVTDCQSNPIGLPVYELKNVSSSFYSISEPEVRRATANSFTQTRFAYACLTQPHDTVDMVRTISIFREFRNIFTKP